MELFNLLIPRGKRPPVVSDGTESPANYSEINQRESRCRFQSSLILSDRAHSPLSRIDLYDNEVLISDTVSL